MGQCMSTANGPPDEGGAGPTQGTTQGPSARKYNAVDKKQQDENKAIIEGLAGVYKVLKLLGSGSFASGSARPASQPDAFIAGAEGNTYLVQDVATNQNWAIKLIKLPLPTRFVQAIFRHASSMSPRCC